MVSKKMLDLGKIRSGIRDIYEYGNKLAEEIGAENVLDFSLEIPVLLHREKSEIL